MEEPVLPAVPVIADGLLSDVRPALLCLGDAVAHAGHLVCHAHLALPLVLGHLHQRRLDALQVVDGRAGLAAEQVAQPVAHAAVVVVLHHPLGHELLAGQVGGQELVHQELEHLHLGLQRLEGVLLALLHGQDVLVLGVALAVGAHHLGPRHAVDEVERGVDAVLEVGGAEGGVGRVLLAQDGLEQGDVRLGDQRALLLSRQGGAEVLEAERRQTQHRAEVAEDLVDGRRVQDLPGRDHQVVRRLGEVQQGDFLLLEDGRSRAADARSPATYGRDKGRKGGKD